MKIVVLIVALLLIVDIHAQEDKSLTLVVSGGGITREDATRNALRGAVEQAFGVFISSKTELLDDSLIREGITAVSSGNIQGYEVISELQIPPQGYNIYLKVTVSVSSLISFVESKGVEVEFKGSLFAFNLNQQLINEKNEIQAIVDLGEVVSKLSQSAFDYSLVVSDPLSLNNSTEKWSVPMQVIVSTNSNVVSIITNICATLKGLSLSDTEARDYIRLGRMTYPVFFGTNEANHFFVLRSEQSIVMLLSVLQNFNRSIQNFKISDGSSEWTISEYPKNVKYVYDGGFRIFLKRSNLAGCFFAGSVYYDDVCNQCNDGRQKVILTNKYSVWCNLSEIIHSPSWVVEYQVDLTKPMYDGYFGRQFDFLKNMKNVLNTKGIAVSFRGVQPMSEIATFYYEDVKTLAEINKIVGYKVYHINDLNGNSPVSTDVQD